MTKEPNPYKEPFDLLISCVQNLSKEELTRRFAPEGEGLFLQEVVDVSRVRTMEDLLDSFSIDLEDPAHPKPETEEWLIVFQWHPVNRQLIAGEELRRRLEVSSS